MLATKKTWEVAVLRLSVIARLVATMADPSFLSALRIVDHEASSGLEGDTVSRAEVAMALNAMLFAGLLARVPTGKAYVEGVVAAGGRVHFDHGALRTIAGETGALPSGFGAFARLLAPLGYDVADIYPLPRLRMTGRAFVQTDHPEDVPQFFVSELHVQELPEEAQEACARVFGNAIDPIGASEQMLLNTLARDKACAFEVAAAGLPGLVGVFGRSHPEPDLADYQTLLRHSAEAAWIATEGNAFNHATDRVVDIEALVARLRAEAMPLKAEIETSANGRIRQTALLADKVSRRFRLADGTWDTREVPGSFYEFIQRAIDPQSGTLDLAFDSANATGIFAVTQAR